jgi:hypothetical protein
MGFAYEQGMAINPLLQGGIAAIYDAGSLLGAFRTGHSFDRHGRMSSAALVCIAAGR